MVLRYKDKFFSIIAHDLRGLWRNKKILDQMNITKMILLISKAGNHKGTGYFFNRNAEFT